MKFETRAIRVGQPVDTATGAVIMPIYQSTTYAFRGVGEPASSGFEYSRTGNPTRTALQACLASLEEAKHCVAFSSGMAACEAVLSMLRPGDNVIAVANIYGGTIRLFDMVWKDRGVTFTYVDGKRPEAFAAAITPATKMIWIETPTNPNLELTDIAAVSDLARKRGVPVVVDNTFLSPYFQQPLTLGADIVLHSTTKYIGGHSDVIGGAVATNSAEFNEKLLFHQNTIGAVPSAFDCYLALRGVKTLAVRMRQHAANAQAIAEFLAGHPAVETVRYPGLPTHPQRELVARQMKGCGGMVTFELRGGRPALERFVSRLRCFFYSESLGGVESLVCHPQTMSHAVLTEEQRLAMGVTPQTARLSIGIEHIDDLLGNLKEALA